MDIQELAEAAIKQINNERDFLPLVMPHRNQPHEHYCLSGLKSPKGKFVGIVNGGELVHFIPLDVLAYCVVHGASVEVKTADQKEM